MAAADRKDTTEQAEFREQCQKWLKANHPGRPPVQLPQGALELSDPAALQWLQQWQKSAYDGGLIGCDYPLDVGGGGKENCQGIANQEMQKAKTPYLPNIIGMGIFHLYGMRFNGNASFPLQVHIIQYLSLHPFVRNCMGDF